LGGSLEVVNVRHVSQQALMSGYCGRQIVGIDLHRRRSVLVRMTPEGEVLGKARIDNDPACSPSRSR